MSEVYIQVRQQSYLMMHVKKKIVGQVVRLGKELNLEVLVTTAEASIISGHWTGQNLLRLIKLLSSHSPEHIRAMLHRFPRATISELEATHSKSHSLPFCLSRSSTMMPSSCNHHVYGHIHIWLTDRRQEQVVFTIKCHCCLTMCLPGQKSC